MRENHTATTMRPSGWRTAAVISPSAPVPGSKLVAGEPLKLKRAIRLRATLLAKVNRPAAITLPSGWGMTTLTASFVPGAGTKVGSSCPGVGVGVGVGAEARTALMDPLRRKTKTRKTRRNGERCTRESIASAPDNFHN